MRRYLLVCVFVPSLLTMWITQLVEHPCLFGFHWKSNKDDFKKTTAHLLAAFHRYLSLPTAEYFYFWQTVTKAASMIPSVCVQTCFKNWRKERSTLVWQGYWVNARAVAFIFITPKVQTGVTCFLLFIGSALSIDKASVISLVGS